ncbi:MAG: HAD-IIIC family phosphatase [Acidobacteria bacterium]|nr:HAD-IIIC family phosphatase [Acidobacteriota bacterium]
MKLAEALQILNAARSKDAPLFRISLCCGFTPLHLATMLQAHLQSRFEGRKVELDVGLYGDLTGNVERASAGAPHAVAIAIEWPDLDPRLGYRRLGGWSPSLASTIVGESTERLGHLEKAIRSLSAHAPVAVALPGLRLPPAFLPVNAKSSPHAIQLELAVAEFAAAMAAARVTVVNSQTLDLLSPPSSRHDLKWELHTGFPYTQHHADVLGALLADCMAARDTPKKGLITDLDDTLWRGIVGEAGPQGISWDLENHSQVHGIYQQLLASLAGQGVLLAAASKNDPSVVRETFEQRKDLLISAESLFPLEVHWGAKSDSVARIVRTWNVGPESVVFVDDSPLEIAEVQGACPDIECILFPKNDPAAALELFYRLRDLFGKDAIAAEDALRLESIRQGIHFQQEIASSAGRREEFLSQLDAAITFTLNPAENDARVLELVNKTNQFNLNGIRFSEAEWGRLRLSERAALLSVSYTDKFGPLGTVAVLAGVITGADLHTRAWVMSCRAFSRRIEHQTLRFLFDHYPIERIVFDFRPTARNGPFREFAATFLGREPEGEFPIRRDEFLRRCPPLHHKTESRTREVLA